MRRLFIDLAVPLGVLLCLSLPLLSSDSAGPALLADPFDYAANVANGDVALGARLVPRKEVRKVFKDRLFPNERLLRFSKDFTVVEVGFYPSDEKSVAVDLQAFRFMSGQRPVSAVTPEDAVFEFVHGRSRDSPIRLGGNTHKGEHAGLYEAAMTAALFLHGLPAAAASGPRAGYLYFPVERKYWKSAESVVVEYGSAENAMKLILPVSR